MLFNTPDFIFIFIPVLLFFYRCLSSHPKGVVYLLSISSIIFYGFWSIKYLLLLLLSIVVNFIFSAFIMRNQSKKRFYYVFIGIAFNIILLFYFKYKNFFLQTIGLNQLNEIVLPLGISFYTFTQIAYLVDVYRGDVKVLNLQKYFLFITYFPHLIAGPIIHHQEMMPQFKDLIPFRWKNIHIGLLIIFIGLIKKILVADNFGHIIDPLFLKAKSANLDFFESWISALGYTLQLYFDFSGYCDIAIGLSFLFGIKLPINFDSPYKAKNITDFWRRWHITLSRFLRRYLYIPMGGNKLGNLRQYLNLFLVMLIGGIWHGAGWGFIVWGACHGVLLVIHKKWCSYKKFSGGSNLWMYAVLSQGTTFLCVTLLWVFFRAENISAASNILCSMGGFHDFLYDEKHIIYFATIFFFLWVVFFLPNTQSLFKAQNVALWDTKIWVVRTKTFRVIESFVLKISDHKKFLKFFMYIFISYYCVAFFMIFLSLPVENFRQIFKKNPNINISFVDNKSGTFLGNFWSHFSFQDVYKDKIYFVGSSYTIGIQPFYLVRKGEKYLVSSVGIGGNSLLNGFRSAFQLLEAGGVKKIIFSVSPLGYGKIFAQSMAFNEDCRPFISDKKNIGISYLTGKKLTLSNYFFMLRNPRNQVQPYFFDAFSKIIENIKEGQKNSVIIPEINVSGLSSKVHNVNYKEKNDEKFNRNNGEEKYFKWYDREIIESMQKGGDVFQLFQLLKKECDKRSISLVVYETPTVKNSSDPNIYPVGFYEEYLHHAKQMFKEVEVKYIDASDFFSEKLGFMIDFIHPRIDLMNYLAYKIILEDLKETIS